MEERRLQSAAALKRLAVVLAFVSVRMIQLHQLAQANPEAASTAVLTQEEVECLWASTERAPYPEEAPTVAWAYGALAKLGGFYDSRGTGRPGWQALEKGWLELQARVAGWRLAIKHKRLVI